MDKKADTWRGNAIHEACQGKLVASDRKAIKTYAFFQVLGLSNSNKQASGKAKIALEIMDLGIKSHQDSIESISH